MDDSEYRGILCSRPVCDHGETRWEGDRPLCGQRACAVRWFLRYLLPVLVLMAVVLTVGLLWPELDIGNIGEVSGHAEAI